MYHYELLVRFSDEDRCYIASVPDLPGCSAHGATPVDAVAAAQEAIALWIDTARDDGIPIPEPGHGRLSRK